MRRSGVVDAYLRRWNLEPVGAVVETSSSRLGAVRRAGEPAMLKVALAAEEVLGAELMVWWAGRGAARVLAHEGPALLLEYGAGGDDPVGMVRRGQDDDDARALCAVVAELHAVPGPPPPFLTPLDRWFRALPRAAGRLGGIIGECAAAAEQLLAEPRDVVVLHGDLHHGNVLHFGERGLLAIDPKGLRGERGFDYANLFCNPDHATATAPGRLARLADLVAAQAGLDRGRLLRWVLAYAGLSAAWSIEDGAEPRTALAVAEAAIEAGEG